MHLDVSCVSDEDKSALALAFSHVAEQRKLAIVAESAVDVNNDGVIDEKDAELEMLELGAMERDLMSSSVYDEFITPEEELRRMFDRVERSMQVRYMESSVPVWRRTFFDGSDSKEHQVTVSSLTSIVRHTVHCSFTSILLLSHFIILFSYDICIILHRFKWTHNLIPTYFNFPSFTPIGYM